MNRNYWSFNVSGIERVSNDAWNLNKCICQQQNE